MALNMQTAKNESNINYRHKTSMRHFDDIIKIKLGKNVFLYYEYYLYYAYSQEILIENYGTTKTISYC